MVCVSINIELNTTSESCTVYLAHLKHRVRRVVILDIDLHHGTRRFIFVSLIYFDRSLSRKRHTVYRLANQRGDLSSDARERGRQPRRKSRTADILWLDPRRIVISMRGLYSFPFVHAPHILTSILSRTENQRLYKRLLFRYTERMDSISKMCTWSRIPRRNSFGTCFIRKNTLVCFGKLKNLLLVLVGLGTMYCFSSGITFFYYCIVGFDAQFLELRHGRMRTRI